MEEVKGGGGLEVEGAKGETAASPAGEVGGGMLNYLPNRSKRKEVERFP